MCEDNMTRQNKHEKFPEISTDQQRVIFGMVQALPMVNLSSDNVNCTYTRNTTQLDSGRQGGCKDFLLGDFNEAAESDQWNGQGISDGQSLQRMLTAYI